MPFRTPPLAQRLRERAGLTKNLRRLTRAQLLVSALLLCACSAAPAAEDSPAASSAALCRPPEGVSGSPRTIEEAVTLLNALPKPTSVACFLESLDRPLQAIATRNIVSAQPAFSAASPRIFLRRGQLVLSVVPEGAGSRLLEFSFLLEGDTRSIKAELALPLTDSVPRSAPYEHVLPTDPVGLARGGTVCGGCHGNEQRVQNIDFAPAFSSVSFRPNPSFQVSLETLAAEQKSCDPAAQPERCAMLTALFGHGPVTPAEFPNTMVIFN